MKEIGKKRKPLNNTTVFFTLQWQKVIVFIVIEFLVLVRNIYNNLSDLSSYTGGSGEMVSWRPVEPQSGVRFSPTALFIKEGDL